MTTTAKGVPHPADSDPFNVVADLALLAAWLDARPGVSTHTTAERDVLVGADIWAGRVIYNSTTDRLEINRTGVAGAANWGPLAIADISGVTAFARTLLDDTDAATARATLGAQASDATLTALAALTVAANQLVYATGSESFSTTALSAFARTLLDDPDAATARATLGAQASDTDLTAIAALTSAANKLLYATGAGTWALADLTPFARTLLDDADAATARATLGAQAAGSYQPLDTDLTAIAALASAANKLLYATGAGTWALADLTAFARTLLDDADAAAVRATLGLDARYAPGTLLAAKSYLPASPTTYSATGGPLVDVDAANAAVTFTTITSNVIVVLNAVCGGATGSDARIWGIREGTSQVDQQQAFLGNVSVEPRLSARFYIGGLTPGSSHTYKFAHGGGNAQTSVIKAGFGGGTGPWYGPITMEVYSA